jgi:hypothetical protein
MHQVEIAFDPDGPPAGYVAVVPLKIGLVDVRGEKPPLYHLATENLGEHSRVELGLVI